MTSRVLLVTLFGTVLCGSLLPAQSYAQSAASQQRQSHPAAHHHPRAPSAAVDETPVLGPDDARYLLDRTGFQPDQAEVRAYLGLTREQAVDQLLAGSLTAARTPPPDWVDTPWVARDVRKNWTPDQRRDEQKLRGQRYNELRAWWLREMLTTPSPLT